MPRKLISNFREATLILDSDFDEGDVGVAAILHKRTLHDHLRCGDHGILKRVLEHSSKTGYATGCHARGTNVERIHKWLHIACNESPRCGDVKVRPEIRDMSENTVASLCTRSSTIPNNQVGEKRACVTPNIRNEVVLLDSWLSSTSICWKTTIMLVKRMTCATRGNAPILCVLGLILGSFGRAHASAPPSDSVRRSVGSTLTWYRTHPCYLYSLPSVFRAPQ